MNILLVNEAGCFAPGIIALAKALSKQHRVVIVGPLQPQIRSGHKITTGAYPLRVKQYFVLNKIKIFSVNGTPVDCVTLALDKILRSKPDLIISGISGTPSRGEVIYTSGVVSAAIAGTIQGIPSIAISAKIRDESDEKSFLPIANMFAKRLSYFVKNLSPGVTLNINYPERYFGGKIICTPLTCNIINNKYTCEVNPFGNMFYWLKEDISGWAAAALGQKGDIYWLKKGYITITPLKLDLTNDEAVNIIAKSGIKL
jgi:5'-nucleotidase